MPGMNRDFLAEAMEGGEEVNDMDDKAFLGFLKAQVVGIQHYTGHVSANELVTLLRQPQNPYDANAIQVNNVEGVQVGHVPRIVAEHLAPLMDSGSLALEGMVPSVGGVYKLPLQLSLYATRGQEGTVQAALRRGGIAVQTEASQSGGYADYEALSQGSSYRGSPSQRQRGSSSQASPSKRGTVRLDKAEVEDGLSRLFERLLEAETAVPSMRAAARVVTPLLAHQREALAWMVARENSGGLPPFWEPRKPLDATAAVAFVNTLTNFATKERLPAFRGGCLCDDMGLGKTITVLALIATNAAGAELPEVTMEARAASEPPPSKKRRTGRASTTSTSAASASPGKAAHAKLTPAQQKLHGAAAALEEPAAAPAADGPSATLVVTPVSVLGNWEAQAREHAPGLSCCLYHGPDRLQHKAAGLAKFDMVVTTYGLLVSDPHLKKVKWLRVVLDEGHFVRNAATKQSKAAAALEARFRWIVSGTPIQNSMKDLFGLLSFLQLGPLDKRDIFRASLERPMKLGDPCALLRLKVLMGQIAKRRLKTSMVNGRPLVALPAKHVSILKVDLVGAQRAKYDEWECAGRAIISRHLEAKTLLQNYSTVLEILLRLRQICDSGALVCKAVPTGDEGARQAMPQELVLKLAGLIAAGALDECPICMDDVQNACITPCGHVFCRGCIEHWVLNQAKACPMCRKPIAKSGLCDAPADVQGAAEGLAPDGASAEGTSSAKITHLLAALAENEAQSTREGRAVKAVVFSQFTGMLDLVGTALHEAGTQCVRIDGSVPASRRQRLLEQFALETLDSPRVALVSLKAGGVGVNLVSACQCHLLDPWWNPATEEQAMDRVHRIGQKRDVQVFRYICTNTIEERMVLLQEKKRELAMGAFERRRPDQVAAARLADVRQLMLM